MLLSATPADIRPAVPTSERPPETLMIKVAPAGPLNAKLALLRLMLPVTSITFSPATPVITVAELMPEAKVCVAVAAAASLAALRAALALVASSGRLIFLVPVKVPGPEYCPDADS